MVQLATGLEGWVGTSLTCVEHVLCDCLARARASPINIASFHCQIQLSGRFEGVSITPSRSPTHSSTTVVPPNQEIWHPLPSTQHRSGEGWEWVVWFGWYHIMSGGECYAIFIGVAAGWCVSE
jgi:hypothetical protein